MCRLWPCIKLLTVNFIYFNKVLLDEIDKNCLNFLGTGGLTMHRYWKRVLRLMTHCTAVRDIIIHQCFKVLRYTLFSHIYVWVQKHKQKATCMRLSTSVGTWTRSWPWNGTSKHKYYDLLIYIEGEIKYDIYRFSIFFFRINIPILYEMMKIHIS